MDTNESMDKTRRGFETSFSETKYYDVQTYDDEHLQRIISFLDIEEGFSVLDLGTGSGFLAFPLADRFPESRITGLDIVPKTLARNMDRVRERNVRNLDFVCYDGIQLPFEDDTFDVIVSRYCLHHFPNIEKSFAEIARVLKPFGQLLISDPTPNDDDDVRFVDTYMKMKDDGHIQFYTKAEFTGLAEQAGLTYEKSFDSCIRFPRKCCDEYKRISEGVDENIIRGYDIRIHGEEVFISVRVLNLSFRKK